MFQELPEFSGTPSLHCGPTADLTVAKKVDNMAHSRGIIEYSFALALEVH